MWRCIESSFICQGFAPIHHLLESGGDREAAGRPLGDRGRHGGVPGGLPGHLVLPGGGQQPLPQIFHGEAHKGEPRGNVSDN